MTEVLNAVTMEEREMLAQRLRVRLADDNWTQRTFAKEAGLTETTVRNILKGKVHVQSETLRKMARALKTTTADLLGHVVPNLPPDLRTLLDLLQTLTRAEQRALIILLRARARLAAGRGAHRPKGKPLNGPPPRRLV